MGFQHICIKLKCKVYSFSALYSNDSVVIHGQVWPTIIKTGHNHL